MNHSPDQNTSKPLLIVGTVHVELHTEDPGIGTTDVVCTDYARIPVVYVTPALLLRNAKGRKARWKVRHDLRRKRRRRPHTQREVRCVRRLIADWDARHFAQKAAG